MKWTHEVYCVIEMTSKELARKTEGERVLDHRMTKKDAAAKLGISERQFRRILKQELDLACEDAPVGTAVISQTLVNNPSALLHWTGTITFATAPNLGEYQLLIREYDYLWANYTIVTRTHRGQPIQRE